MLNITNENGKLNIEANASMFIIPNSAGHIKDFCMTDRILRTTNKYCEDNNISFNEENDWLVQIWIQSGEQDLFTDNFFRHALLIDYDDKEYYVTLHSDEWIPKQLIDVSEGEVVTLHFNNVTLTHKKDEDEMLADLTLHVTADQLNYRYRNHGRFEEVLQKVCRTF